MDVGQFYIGGDTWSDGSKLNTAGLNIASSVGDGPAAEFNAFVSLYDKMPDVEPASTKHAVLKRYY